MPVTISPEHMRRLRMLKRATGRPILELVVDAPAYYFEHRLDAIGERE